jgi:hypothetical protein
LRRAVLDGLRITIPVGKHACVLRRATWSRRPPALRRRAGCFLPIIRVWAKAEKLRLGGLTIGPV